jgi:hypothetical protein
MLADRFFSFIGTSLLQTTKQNENYNISYSEGLLRERRRFAARRNLQLGGSRFVRSQALNRVVR